MPKVNRKNVSKINLYSLYHTYLGNRNNGILTVITKSLGGEDLSQLYDVRVVHFLPHVHNVHTLRMNKSEACK